MPTLLIIYTCVYIYLYIHVKASCTSLGFPCHPFRLKDNPIQMPFSDWHKPVNRQRVDGSPNVIVSSCLFQNVHLVIIESYTTWVVKPTSIRT